MSGCTANMTNSVLVLHRAGPNVVLQIIRVLCVIQRLIKLSTTRYRQYLNQEDVIKKRGEKK